MEITFNQFLQTHETFQLALIEALHRYFYDHCFDQDGKLFDTEEAKYYFDLHQLLHCNTPDWRFRLKKKLERYDAWERTSALDVGGKPKRKLEAWISVIAKVNYETEIHHK